MRIALLIKDSEYRDALVERLSSYDNDIFVNVVKDSTKDTSDCLILTDIKPAHVDSKVLEALKDRTVFLTDSRDSIPDDLYGIFKFSSIPSMISELSIAYDRWHGTSRSLDHTAKFITVCSESDAYSSEYCAALARQIIYRNGGRVMIIPLSYINDYGLADAGNTNNLSRLLYSIQSGRYHGTSSYAYTDSYGVSVLLLRPGINPVALLDKDELLLLISGLTRNFDIVIGDVATCFRKENTMLMDMSDYTLAFERGRRDAGFSELLSGINKLFRIKITGGTEDVISIDDCVKEIFRMDRDEGIKN